MANFLEVADGLLRSGDVGPFYKAAFETVFKARAQLQSVHSKARLDLYNIESVFGAFEMARRFRKPFGDLDLKDVERLGDSMRLLILRTLELTTRFRLEGERLVSPHPYEDFARTVSVLFRKSTVSIISFNYDIGVEAGLAALDVPIDYCLTKASPDPDRVSLVKLHGSINWGRCKNCNEIAIVPFNEYCSTYPYSSNKPQGKVTIGPYCSRVAPFTCVQIGSWVPAFKHTCGHILELKMPAIVPPTWEKAEYNVGFENMWAHAANHLSEAENIVVIGYSLPSTDQFFPILYALGTVSRTVLKRFWIVNPSALEIRERFEGILGEAARQKLRSLPWPFAGAIPYLGELLSDL